MPSTSNYGWSTPAVGGSNGAWGTILNAAIDAIDAALHTVSGIADAALPKAGGVLTGRLDAKTATMTRSDLGSVTGATPLNLANAQCFTFTVSGSVQLSMANVPAGAVTTGVVLKISNGSNNIIWPTGTKWPGGTTPALSASGKDIVVLMTHDGGTTWDAWVAALDVR